MLGGRTVTRTRLVAVAVVAALAHGASSDDEASETADPASRRVTMRGIGGAGKHVRRIDELMTFLDRQPPWRGARIVYLQGDASTRSYARLMRGRETVLLMDAPHQPDGPPVRGGRPYSRIAHLADAPYTEISGGEQQLVQIARVLAQGPALMILDEPTAHLDFANQARFLALLRRLARQGLGVIFTTHAPDHAHALADRTLILSPSHPPQLGPTAALLTEATLSGAYGVPIRLVRADGHVACVAVVE